MSQVVETHAPQSSTLESREEVLLANRPWADGVQLAFARKNQVVGYRIVSDLEGVQHACVAQRKKLAPQLARHIDATAPVALRSTELPAVEPALHQDVPVRVRLTLAELEVSPAQTENLSLPETTTQGDQEQHIVFSRTVFFRIGQEPLYFAGFHRLRLMLALLTLHESAESEGGIHG
ncbi:MAG: hypothetical protein WAQ52_07960 [Terriglobales bacterium]